MPHVPEPMRHIPEEELHAYLDQALSRSQCVEIEHHLSGCVPCRAERDAIAALRDRTTSLLLAAAPRRIRPRPFTHLSATLVEQTSRRSRRLRTAAWAASLVAAVGLGWALSRATTTAAPLPEETAVVNLPKANQEAPAAPPRVTRPTSLASLPTRPKPNTPPPPTQQALSQDSTVEAPSAPPRPATSQLASLGSTSTAAEPVLAGVWRTVPWTNTQNERDEWVPRVDGVPVVQVKQRQAPQGGRPITLVTQQLANGEMISTVEGPAPEVAALLRQQPGQSASAELQDMEVASRPLPSDSAQRTAQPGSVPRTLAIFGSAPSDSLKAFMLRVK